MPCFKPFLFFKHKMLKARKKYWKKIVGKRMWIGYEKGGGGLRQK